MKQYQISISGKAWNALPLGNDPHYKPDRPELERLRAAAVVRFYGRGSKITLVGSRGDLLYLAGVYADHATIFAPGNCDSLAVNAEGRAMLEAAKKIRSVLQE